MNIKVASCLAIAAVALSGCVNHTWAPGPTATMPFSQASGRCKLAALSGNEGFLAIGSADYVAGAAIGNGIGNAVRQNRIYNACMEAQGFVAVDMQPRPQPSIVQQSSIAPAAQISTCLPGQPCSCGGGPNLPTECKPDS